MKNKKLLLRIFIYIFSLSIVPLLYMGRYIHPLWDDYGSAFFSHMIIELKLFPLIICVAVINAIGTWFLWQGTYSAEFLFNLQPGIWPIPLYWITPYIIIGSISFAYILFFRNLSKYIFKSDSEYGTLFALATLTVQFQFVPFLHQGFYWYNGSIYYGFFHALLLIELAQVIKFLFSDLNRIRWLPAIALIISGGNYSTALIHCLILIIISILLTIQKSNKKKQFWAITITALIGLIISMIAPGNAVRDAQTTSMPAFRAIFTSIINALRYVYHWLRVPHIVLIIVIIPIIYLMVRNIRLSFAKMLVIQIILFGLFAAEETPPFYAMSYAGDTRQIDMYYYSFCLIIVLGLICFMTWLNSVLKPSTITAHKKLVSVSLLAALAVTLLLGIYTLDISDFNSYKVTSEVLSGRASAYDAEYKEIINEITNSGDICVIDDIENYSDILPPFMITEDPKYWVNDGLAQYYGKKEVRLRNK